jgi:hypothetical protein
MVPRLTFTLDCLDPACQLERFRGREVGSNAFGVEEVHGVRKHAFEHNFEFVADGLTSRP